MNRRRLRFVLGGLVIAAVLGGLVLSGVRQSVVYFVTPSELRAATDQTAGRAYRLGGMVVAGSIRADPATLRYDFELSDGMATLPVRFRGIPPDLFAEGRGAVVEGTLGADGTFQASTIMAKHSEEYRPPANAQSGYHEVLRTLRGDDARGGQAGGAR
jgi:cytochrome c-type biogenesis protein CcmE